jgi:hypothetical protein
MTFNISRVMYRHKIKTVGLWPRKISSFLQPVEADTGMKRLGVYDIFCKLSGVHWTNGNSYQIRVKKHDQQICH